MLKKRILLIGSLLVLSIAGQVLLRPCLGKSEAGQADWTTPRVTTSEQDNTDSTPAVPLKEHELSRETEAFESLIRTFFYMLGFVALIGVGAWLVCRKFSCSRTGGGRRTIRVGENVRMGPRKALHLICVGEKTFLVGSSGDTLSLLADVSGSVNPAEDKNDA